MKFIPSTKFVYLLAIAIYALCPTYVVGGSVSDTLFGKPSSSSTTDAGKSDQEKGTSSSNQTATNQTAQQTLPLEENFKDDKYENFAPRENDERKIFDESLLGS